MLFKTKGFIEPKGSRRDFEGGFFFVFGSTSIRSTVVTGQKACVCALMQATEGLRVGCGGKNKVFIKPLALGWFVKVDNRFGYEKWLQGGSIGL